MRLHPKAALLPRQRAELRAAYRAGESIAQLARRFGVSFPTAKRWAHRDDSDDHSCAPHQHGRRVVTEEYRHAVLALRNENPRWGPRRIADELRPVFPTANCATVWRILSAAGQSQRPEKKTHPPPD
jgi:transposase